MIISLNWLKKFVPIDRPVDEIVELIGSRLVEIESVTSLGEIYRDVVVAQVKQVLPHPDADRLHVVLIDDGGRREVERDAAGLVQVVCGAKNVQEGMFVAWLPPGATVPASADSEPFVLEARKLRGVKSNGMLASAQELALSNDHDGIVAIDKPTVAGASFAELYELNDYLLDIDNKSLTHRPDVFGIIGFAREVAAIQGLQFESPKWLTMFEPILAEMQSSSLQAPTVTIADAGISDRYQAVVLADCDTVLPSPLQIQSYLSRLGVRPMSAAIDTTNYLMLLTGQPLHAFDYDAFVAESSTRKPDIVVRKSRQGETLTLLDGRTITLSDEDIIIAAGETPVAIAGAMGGVSTEITTKTKNILLEVATFDLYSLRATQMRHGIYSEALTRFTKGQPAAMTAPVLASAVRMLSDITGGRRVSEIVEAGTGTRVNAQLKVKLQKINAVLGTNLSAEAAAIPLQHVECIATPLDDDTLQVTVPHWRHDIAIDEDVIEEIGRILGYDMIAPALPQRSYTAVAPESMDSFKAQLRQRLSSAGANEVLTYSFVHGKVLDNAGQNADQAYRITNAISPDLQFYRLSLQPSLLSKVHANIKQGFDHFALYEFNQVHQKGQMDKNEPAVPAVLQRAALTVVAAKKVATKKGSAFYQAKYLLEFMLKGQRLEWRPLEQTNTALEAPFQPGRSAQVLMKNEVIGVVGEYTSSARQHFKLPDYAAGFEIDLALAFTLLDTKPHFTPPPRFQGTAKDICIQLSPAATYTETVRVVETYLAQGQLEWQLEPVDIYQPEDATYKNITLRITFHDTAKTIDMTEVKRVLAGVSESLAQELQAKII